MLLIAQAFWCACINQALMQCFMEYTRQQLNLYIGSNSIVLQPLNFKQSKLIFRTASAICVRTGEIPKVPRRQTPAAGKVEKYHGARENWERKSEPMADRVAAAINHRRWLLFLWQASRSHFSSSRARGERNKLLVLSLLEKWLPAGTGEKQLYRRQRLWHQVGSRRVDCEMIFLHA